MRDRNLSPEFVAQLCAENGTTITERGLHGFTVAKGEASVYVTGAPGSLWNIHFSPKRIAVGFTRADATIRAINHVCGR